MQRGVHTRVATKLAVEAKVERAGRIQTKVRDTQSGKALAHCTESILHCVRLDWLLVGGETAITVALGKDLEDEDGVINIGEGVIGAKGSTEGVPV